MNLEQFKQYLVNPDPQVRKKAIMALAKSTYPKKVELLQPLIENDPDPEIREGVKKIIAKLGGPVSAPAQPKANAPAQPAAKAPAQPAVKTPAQPAAAQKGKAPASSTPCPKLLKDLPEDATSEERCIAEAAEMVEEAFASGDPEKKLDVLYKLADGDIGYKEYPTRRLKDFILPETDEKMIQLAMRFIYKEGQQTEKMEILDLMYKGEYEMPKEILLERIEDEMDHACLAEMVRVLGKVGDQNDMILITKQLTHVDDRVRISAIHALQAMGDDFAHEYVIPIINDKDELDHVKAEAAAFVFEKDMESAVYLLKELLDKASDKYKTKTVIDACDRIDSPKLKRLRQAAQEKYDTYDKEDPLKKADELMRGVGKKKK